MSQKILKDSKRVQMIQEETKRFQKLIKESKDSKIFQTIPQDSKRISIIQKIQKDIKKDSKKIQKRFKKTPEHLFVIKIMTLPSPLPHWYCQE